MDQERLFQLTLKFTPGIGDVLIKQLVSYCGSAEQVFKTPKGKLLKIPGIGESTAIALQDRSAFEKAEREFIKAEQQNIEIVFFTDKRFPQRLLALSDSPSLLYTNGNINFNVPKTIGIVGTRNATSYGKGFVDQLIKELVPHHPLIISGLAYGIDIHAHKAALKNGLPTIGVLGSGLDIIYPSAHSEVAKKMINQGGLITENPIGTKPDAHRFPARNRIIAGMCDVLIVVEAALKGGALITAEIANSYNKDVFAVPGNNGQTYSEGCNTLIKSHRANLLMSVKDLEYIMNWSLEGDVQAPVPRQIDLSLFEPHEQTILTILKDQQDPIRIDELSWKSGLAPGVLASHLLSLELKNAVKALPGRAYTLTN